MEWISVKERLPEVNEEVIVCDFAGQICKGHRRTDGRTRQGSEWSLQCGTISVAAETNHIVYWQPLPEFIKRIREEYRIVMEKATKKRCKRKHIIMPSCGNCEHLERLEDG